MLVISRIEACDWFYRRFTVMLVFLSPSPPREGEGILIVESNCDFHVLELVVHLTALFCVDQRSEHERPLLGGGRRARADGGGYPRGSAERRGGFPFPSGEEPVLSLPKDEDGSGLCHAR